VSGKLRAYLELVRIPNIFTAAADITAGFLFVGGGRDEWPALLFLVGGSSCLYAGGVALNDVSDAERDALERPDRPIPSGRVSRREALCLAVVLLGVGFCAAASVSRRAALIAAGIVTAVVLYDVVLKTTPVAPGLMGTCRALNIALGMSGAPTILSVANLVPVASVWLYVTSVTFFARQEARPGKRGCLVIGTVGVGLALGGLAILCRVARHVHGEYLILIALLGLFLGYRGFVAAARLEAASVQRAVKTFVVSLIIFDACIAWAARGPIAGLAVAVLCLPALALGRRFRIT
jgi:4-hydroxybenzoate polyprenyltransferase